MKGHHVAEGEGAEGEEKNFGDAVANMQGTGAEKLALFERLRAAGAFVNEPVTGVAEADKTLRMLAAMEKGSG